ncbi:MAG: molybdopterin-dependent oxidoreductase [Proteobacteria bacterium]|nr:molybdopterin-dependent oxidoreductase [Pseudomonadota bacterium]
MKIDRRNFLTLGGSLVAGGVVGTTLSPLPWKLMDDAAIWTQNWSWTPVPTDGKVSYENTVCTLCPGRCGISVRKVASRAIKIEGRKDFPVNKGGICILGLSGLQLLYGPTRVKTPLMKTGNGTFKTISWDEAIESVSAKLNELRSSGKSDSVAFLSDSDQGVTAGLIKRFLKAYGSPNFISEATFKDAYKLALKKMQGIDAEANFDIDNADYVLSFGSGIIEGWESPVRMIKANSALKTRKAKLCQIEPRLSMTAAKADKWLPVVPGTEKELALALIHVILKKSLYNKDFVARNTVGLDKLTQLTDSFSPEKVSGITGIKPEDIMALAADFARASHPIAICGKGQGNTPESMTQIMAVHTLNTLVGNINKKGGVFTVSLPDYVTWDQPEMDETGTTGNSKDRIDGAGKGQYKDTMSLAHRLAGIVNAQGKNPVEALFVSGSNPLYTFTDSIAVKKAFEKIPFIVSFSSFMDETAKMASIILPNHTNLERFEDVIVSTEAGKSAIGLAKPVVDPRFDTKPTGDALILIAKALEGSVAEAFSWESFEACLEETLGDKWEELKENGFLENADSAIASNNKIDFSALTDNGLAAIEGDTANFPLTLIPYDSLRLAHMNIGSPPFLIKTVEDTVLKGNDILVEINPKTAGKLNLSEGKYAKLKTPKGTVNVKVHLFEGIMPGVIAMARGLGHTAYDDYLAGKGVNFNELIGPVEDPASGLDISWGIRANLTKA